jgi:hypothetical protein
VLRPYRKPTLFEMLAACQFLACTHGTELPPAYGDCVPVADASCTGSAYASGSSGPRPEGGTGFADDGGVSIVDAESCGLDLLQLMPANPLCAPCITQPAPAGCCQSASACSIDPVCTGRVACGSLGPQGLATCLSAEDLNYSEFLSCLTRNCNPACQDLVLDLTAEQ